MAPRHAGSVQIAEGVFNGSGGQQDVQGRGGPSLADALLQSDVRITQLLGIEADHSFQPGDLLFNRSEAGEADRSCIFGNPIIAAANRGHASGTSEAEPGHGSNLISQACICGEDRSTFANAEHFRRMQADAERLVSPRIQ